VTSSYAVTEGSQEGHAIRVLHSPGAELEAAFAPGVGMVGCSLRHRGEELLGQRGGLAKYAESGSSMGIPLLHPWANRLDGLRYAVGGREVELDPDATPLRLDANGLPIHGLATASPHWELTAAEADAAGARLSATLDFAAHPELLAGFPFPHRLEMTATLAGRTLTVETELVATGDVPVPVAFGYHPYLRLPGVPRPEWRVALPVRRRAHLDERGIPTGEDEPSSPPAGPLGDRDYDDLFPELCHPPEFWLEGGGRRLEVRFEQGYPCAQVYGPPGEDHFCFEPMAAPTNALVTGERLRLVPPGERYVAGFSISVLLIPTSDGP
jgi:galactose mutarotase-like enzyme